MILPEPYLPIRRSCKGDNWSALIMLSSVLCYFTGDNKDPLPGWFASVVKKPPPTYEYWQEVLIAVLYAQTTPQAWEIMGKQALIVEEISSAGMQARNLASRRPDKKF